jgi:hypothetical protein
MHISCRFAVLGIEQVPTLLVKSSTKRLEVVERGAAQAVLCTDRVGCMVVVVLL